VFIGWRDAVATFVSFFGQAFVTWLFESDFSDAEFYENFRQIIHMIFLDTLVLFLLLLINC
jgi:hypothetical protein